MQNLCVYYVQKSLYHIKRFSVSHQKCFISGNPLSNCMEIIGCTNLFHHYIFSKFVPNEHSSFSMSRRLSVDLKYIFAQFLCKIICRLFGNLTINFKRYLSLNNTEGVFYYTITFLLKFLVIYYSCTYLLKC